MNEIIEILKYIAPALVVFATAYFMLQKLIDNDQRKRKLEMISANQRIITPIRLQAYERLVLFLERIAPDALIMRSMQQQMTAKQMQSEMLSTIRAEYQHNVSQQIYISANAWKVIKSVKENLIKLINSAADNVAPDASAMELGKKILEVMMKLEVSPTEPGLQYLKEEINKFF